MTLQEAKELGTKFLSGKLTKEELDKLPGKTMEEKGKSLFDQYLKLKK